MALPLCQYPADYFRENRHFRRLPSPGQPGQQGCFWLGSPTFRRKNPFRLALRTGPAPDLRFHERPFRRQQRVVPPAHCTSSRRPDGIGLGLRMGSVDFIGRRRVVDVGIGQYLIAPHS